MRLTGVFVVVVVVGLVIAWIVGSGGSGVAEIGRKAPDFTVEMIDGGSFTLSEAEGRPVVLNLWASWCNPCQEEIPAISEYSTAHPEIQVVGVAVDDMEEDSRQFAARIGASYPLALGTDEVEEAYPFFGLPATYIIDQHGVVTQFFNGIVTQDVLDDLLAGT